MFIVISKLREGSFSHHHCTALCPPAPGVVVGDPHPERHVGLLPAEVDQGGGHDVLDPRPRVAPRDAHLRRLHAAGAKVDGDLQISYF